MSFFKKISFTTTQIILGGFFGVILTGALLLMLPISAQSRQMTPFVDALFASTTAICVTGLTTVVTAEHWSLFGKLVILALIQFGGFGVVTITTTVLLLLKKRVTLTNRLLIQEAYNLDTLRGLVRLTKSIMKGTFLVEGIGALIYAIQFVPEFGVIRGLWYAVFHSVSAFCNAGIDIIGPASFVPYVNNPIINLNTMLLIIVGGIGYPVWWDVIKKIKMAIAGKFSAKKFFQKLELHSKLALIMTAILIFGGALFIFINEFQNEGTIGGLSLGQKTMASLFQSVTFRTAGFYTIPQENLKESSALIGVIWMFIGGSPSGTAGGIKTVTALVLVLAAVSMIRGKQDIEIHRRKIVDGYVKKALAVFLVSFTVLMISTISLSLTENKALIDVLYEAASALGTVGLSRNLTMYLSTAGKYIIIATMYLGRVGPISLALALQVGKERGKKITLPEEKILVG